MKLKLILFSMLVLASCSQQNPVLSVEGGMVQGIPSEASGVTVFKGVPYAAAPVGDLHCCKLP